MNIVQCVDVKKTYRQGRVEVPALKGVSLEIAQGGFVAIAGPSGSGKTTLLNLIGGLDSTDGGAITVDNMRIDSMSQAQLADIRLSKIGFIFQAYNLIPLLSARENVEFVMMLQKVDPKERADRACAILDEVGLKGMYDRRPNELSGGQQQRVAVARAVAARPSIVLADEPTANLDSKTGAGLLEMMLELNAKRNATFIFSTHDNMVMDYAHRLVHVHDGLVVDDVVKTGVGDRK